MVTCVVTSVSSLRICLVSAQVSHPIACVKKRIVTGRVIAPNASRSAC
jgi:hypothetical protein